MNHYSRPARKLLLPSLVLTEVTDRDDPHALLVDHPTETYFVRPKLVPEEGKRRDGKPVWVNHQFNLFPVVLDANGVPWAEVLVFLLYRVDLQLEPVMTTLSSVAGDLALYRKFLDEYEIDWMVFPANKLLRPTYRFNAYLKFAVSNHEMALTTAKRRMSTVVAFYRWLMEEGLLVPENSPWKETEHYVQFRDSLGTPRSKRIMVTDLSLKSPRQQDPYAGTIDDGGKLRPLPEQEQEWLLDALNQIGNPEMVLIHILSLLTGARIQTVLTLRTKHVLHDTSNSESPEMRLAVGPGTGIDTKKNKRLVIHIPLWFYETLFTYALSDRARKRRNRAKGGDTPEQYLFLSQRGMPLYQSKEEAGIFDSTNHRRHHISGQGVRQFISERVIPYIRRRYQAPNFHYRYHDLRATAGMNMTDHQLKLVRHGKTTLHAAREFVRVRMGHESSATTDRYLNFRQNPEFTRWIEQQHEDHLKQLAQSAMDAVT